MGMGLADNEEQRGEFTDDNSFTFRKDIRWAAVFEYSVQLQGFTASTET